MNNLKLVLLKEENKLSFINDMQYAFQYGYETEYGKCDDIILPIEDIENSFLLRGSKSFQAFIDEKAVGGAIVVINEKTQHNHLEFLFVKVGYQNKGVGRSIWNAIESMFPDTKIWETCTPYFEKRNIHFYINRCGFHIVEFYNPKHHDYSMNSNSIGNMRESAEEYFFRFEKNMK